MRRVLASLLALALALAGKTLWAGSTHRNLTVSATIGCNVQTSCDLTQDPSCQVVLTCQKPPQVAASMMSPSLQGGAASGDALACMSSTPAQGSVWADPAQHAPLSLGAPRAMSLDVKPLLVPSGATHGSAPGTTSGNIHLCVDF